MHSHALTFTRVGGLSQDHQTTSSEQGVGDSTSPAVRGIDVSSNPDTRFRQSTSVCCNECVTHAHLQSHVFWQILELAAGASSINLRTPDGRTALMAAVEADRIVIPSLGKGTGVRVCVWQVLDTAGRTAHAVSSISDVLAVQYLMDKAVNPPDVNMANSDGTTAVLLACALGR